MKKYQIMGITRKQSLVFRRSYLKQKLNAKSERIAVFSNFYATARNSELWFLNDIIAMLKRKTNKLSNSIYWLSRLITDCDKPEEERAVEMFDVEAIKRVPIDRIVKINKAGFFINNPFRNERSPSNSLHWNKKKNYWTDYATGEFGDVIDLYSRINNCNFRTACGELQYAACA